MSLCKRPVDKEPVLIRNLREEIRSVGCFKRTSSILRENPDPKVASDLSFIISQSIHPAHRRDPRDLLYQTFHHKHYHKHTAAQQPKWLNTETRFQKASSLATVSDPFQGLGDKHQRKPIHIMYTICQCSVTSSLEVII